MDLYAFHFQKARHAEAPDVHPELRAAQTNIAIGNPSAAMRVAMPHNVPNIPFLRYFIWGICRNQAMRMRSRRP